METLRKIARVLTAHGQVNLASEMDNISLSLREAAGKFWMPRESYLPVEARGSEPFVPEGTDLAVWLYEAAGRFYAIGFAAKQNKPLFHHVYRSESQREQSVKAYADRRRAVTELKQKRQQERREFSHDYQVGDILVSSWGYEQTNIDYYEVTKIIGPQMVEIRKIGKNFIGSHGTSDVVTPDAGHYVSAPMRKKVSQGGYVRLTSFSSARRWDGKPDHQTNSLFGH